MKFYYQNCMGDHGYFHEKELVKAIYTAWNIEAELYLVKNKDNLLEHIVFVPYESNEFNSDILAKYGYYMEDGEKERDIKEIKSGKVVKYDWSEVKQLV